MNIFSLKGYK